MKDSYHSSTRRTQLDITSLSWTPHQHHWRLICKNYGAELTYNDMTSISSYFETDDSAKHL
jgi:hypothetical protein